jgi:hypothetical protein
MWMKCSATEPHLGLWLRVVVINGHVVVQHVPITVVNKGWVRVRLESMRIPDLTSKLTLAIRTSTSCHTVYIGHIMWASTFTGIIIQVTSALLHLFAVPWTLSGSILIHLHSVRGQYKNLVSLNTSFTPLMLISGHQETHVNGCSLD